MFTVPCVSVSECLLSQAAANSDDFLVSPREHNLQQCGQTVYGESATRRGLPELSPQVR